MICFTFNKNLTEIFNVYDVQTHRNDMVSRTIFEWVIVVRTIKMFSLTSQNRGPKQLKGHLKGHLHESHLFYRQHV